MLWTCKCGCSWIVIHFAASIVPQAIVIGRWNPSSAKVVYETLSAWEWESRYEECATEWFRDRIVGRLRDLGKDVLP